MKKLKFAAIDIGSNAIRLLFKNVYIDENERAHFKKSSLIRVPIRLGIDSFINNEISFQNEEQLIKAMMAFKLLMSIHKVKAYRACATSAMRNANNGEQIISRIKEQTDIDIEIISGKQEADIILSTGISSQMDNLKNYLFVDVGGGSTEITLFANGISKFSSSFSIGTLRILKDKIPDGEFIQMKECLKDLNACCSNIEIIGSGGNINKIIKYANPAIEKQITYKELRDIHYDLKQYSHNELMLKYDMNPDRADVIVPASTIFLSIMEWVKADKIHVPQIGVADGIIKQLYFEYTGIHSQI